MTIDSKRGTVWTGEELDAIVADYFAMLKLELGGENSTKSRHRSALMARIGRSHGSVEFKHQNISAVLEELGMPWIKGYRPKKNYQNAIFDAIERFLKRDSSLAERVPDAPPSVSPGSIFVNPPAVDKASEQVPVPLRRLVRMFDPVERDHRNRALGKVGEEFVVSVEGERLIRERRADLARRIRWVAAEDGDGAGYDVLSFEATGKEKLIEVKTTNGSARTPFYLTRNEKRLSEERPADWCIYRVHFFAQAPHIFTIAPPLQNSVNLRAESWRASFE